MKKHLIILLCLPLFFAAQSAFAALTLENSITGIKGKPLKNAQAELAAQQDVPAGTLTATQIRLFYAKGSRAIEDAIAPYGYFKPNIGTALTHKGDAWQAQYSVNPGPKMRVTRLNLRLMGEGAKDKRFVRLLNRFPIKQGQILKTEQYNKAKEALFNLAAKRGYLAARMIKSAIQINLSRYTATVIIAFDTGPRYRFGMAHFSETHFDTAFLRRYLTFKEGAYYTNNKLQRLQEDLASSDYFREVVVQPQKKQAKNLKVPIYIRLEPNKPRQYTFGLGYGTNTGIRGTLGIVFRRITHTGHHFKGFLNASQKQNTLQANYIIPGKHPATDRYDFGASIGHLDLSYGKSFTQKLVASYVSAQKKWQQTLSLTLHHEIYNETGQPTENTTLLMPSVEWMRIKSNKTLNPTKGYRIDFTLRGAKQGLIARENMIQATLSMKLVYPLTRYDRFLFRTMIGHTEINNLVNLPQTLQFRTGGAQSVRGYGFGDIGPGRELVVTSAELQHKIYGDWYVSTFFDMGNASNSFTRNYKRGTGFGVVWLSPVGSISITYARAIDFPGQPKRLQFTMGTDL